MTDEAVWNRFCYVLMSILIAAMIAAWFMLPTTWEFVEFVVPRLALSTWAWTPVYLVVIAEDIFPTARMEMNRRSFAAELDKRGRRWS